MSVCYVCDKDFEINVLNPKKRVCFRCFNSLFMQFKGDLKLIEQELEKISIKRRYL